jgi:hypothetical protein
MRAMFSGRVAWHPTPPISTRAPRSATARQVSERYCLSPGVGGRSRSRPCFPISAALAVARWASHVGLVCSVGPLPMGCPKAHRACYTTSWHGSVVQPCVEGLPWATGRWCAEANALATIRYGVHCPETDEKKRYRLAEQGTRAIITSGRGESSGEHRRELRVVAGLEAGGRPI